MQPMYTLPPIKPPSVIVRFTCKAVTEFFYKVDACPLIKNIRKNGTKAHAMHVHFD